MTALRPQILFTVVLLALAGSGADAQSTEAPQATLDAVYSQGRLTAGYQNSRALNLRGVWVFDSGDVARVEVLDEDKFGSSGGLVGVGYSKVLSPSWSLTGALAFGHGGLNWATRRGDIEVSTKWLEAGDIITRLALYHARYDPMRSDRGARAALVAYLPGAMVLEAGQTFNVSQPGSVRSRMPFISATVGREGDQYVSLRFSRGSEAYQAIGLGQPQLVDFNSRSVGAGWRRWIDRHWGFIALAEHYRNPSYERTTLGAGMFVQW